MPKLPLSQWILSFVCVALGTAGFGRALLADLEAANGSRWMLVIWGLAFLIIGLVVLQFLFTLITGRFARGRRDAVLGSGITMLAGLVLVAISIFDPRDGAFSSGRPVVTGAGAIFFLAGVAIFHHEVHPLPGSDLITAFLPALLLTCFAAVAAGVGLGGQPQDNAAFCFSAPGALILGSLAIFAWWQGIKKFRERSEP